MALGRLVKMWTWACSWLFLLMYYKRIVKIIIVHLWHWIWWLLRVAVICDFAYNFKGSDQRNMAMKLHDAYHFNITSNIYETYVWTWTCTLPPIIMVSWKMGPSNSSFLSFREIFHFHDNGRKDSWTLKNQRRHRKNSSPELPRNLHGIGVGDLANQNVTFTYHVVWPTKSYDLGNKMGQIYMFDDLWLEMWFGMTSFNCILKVVKLYK